MGFSRATPDIPVEAEGCGTRLDRYAPFDRLTPK
jgi:hypothetical protein